MKARNNGPKSAFPEGFKNQDLTVLEQIRFTSIWSPLDLMIVPNTSSLMPVGRMQRVMRRLTY